ncbi:hypothetical protein AB0K02_10860 [Streptomyces sp. NPDC049597]
MDLAEIGAYDAERTGLCGVNRLALTDADATGCGHDGAARATAHGPLRG